MKRRDFLRAAVLVPTLLTPFSVVWAARVPDAASRRLMVVFLRGAVDGLNLLVPYNDGHYYDYRPAIAVREGKGDDRAQDLDGQFALHPSLSALLPLWRDKSLAFVQCCGSPDDTRSHFDAQDYMESGTPGVKTTPDGWMNRVLAGLPGEHHATRAVSFGPVLPRIVKGEQVVTNIAVGKAATRPMAVDRPVVSDVFDKLYRGDDALARAYRDGQQGRRQVMTELSADMEGASMGAPEPRGFDRPAMQAAKLLAREGGTQLAFLAVGGWDTHVNQGGATGQLANRLKPLGEGLMTLVRGLGSTYAHTVIVVMSEFGRTVRENGNGGTDHGHGNLMWVMGGPVRGGKVYGDWRGLAQDQLYEGRDLPVTTDFRDVYARILCAHLGVPDAQMAAVFPRYRSTTASVAGLIT